MNGFGQAPIKQEGTTYNSLTGEITKSLPYVHNPVDSAKSHLYWAIARIQDALDEDVVDEYDVFILKAVIEDLKDIRKSL